jgi:hypothetical protein
MSLPVLVSAPPKQQSVVERRTTVPMLIFGMCCGVYAFTAAGRLDSSDGGVVALTARQLLQHGTVRLPAGAPNVIPGVGGFGYSKYGIAQSIVEMPFAAVGFVLRHFTHNERMVDFAISYTNTVITALACVMFYLLLRGLGASSRRGIALTLIYSFATLAWPYAKSDFNEPLQTLAMVTAGYAALRSRQTGRMRWIAASGGALAVGILTKSALGVVVPGYALYVASAGLLDGEWKWHLAVLRKAGWWRELARRQAVLWLPVAVAGAITLWLNVIKFGSPLNFGYDVAGGDHLFSGPIIVGVFGLLFSFNTGIIFYATPVLLSLFGLRRFIRTRPHESILVALLTLVMLILYGGYQYWAGLAAYGPRYLVVPLIPFLLLPALDAFPGVGENPAVFRGALVVAGMAVTLGVLEQLLGVMVSFGAYSLLTCTRFPCPASLDASQSELLYDVWLLPTSLAYNVLGHVPHVDLHAYPFGAPPPGRFGWQDGLVDRLRYFWFVVLPHPRVALIGGLIVWGAVVAATGRELFQRTWKREAAHITTVDTPSRQGAAT